MRRDARMRILCYMAVTGDLYNVACENYSEGEEIEDVKARLHLTQHTIGIIQRLIEEEQNQ